MESYRGELPKWSCSLLLTSVTQLSAKNKHTRRPTDRATSTAPRLGPPGPRRRPGDQRDVWTLGRILRRLETSLSLLSPRLLRALRVCLYLSVYDSPAGAGALAEGREAAVPDAARQLARARPLICQCMARRSTALAPARPNPRPRPANVAARTFSLLQTPLSLPLRSPAPLVAISDLGLRRIHRIAHRSADLIYRQRRWLSSSS